MITSSLNAGIYSQIIFAHFKYSGRSLYFLAEVHLKPERKKIKKKRKEMCNHFLFVDHNLLQTEIYFHLSAV